jgi:hypothetical protein
MRQHLFPICIEAGVVKMAVSIDQFHCSILPVPVVRCKTLKEIGF